MADPLPHPHGKEYVKVRRSKTHGRGLFAACSIPEGTRIIEYTGEKVTRGEGNRRAIKQWDNGRLYIFRLNQRYDLDGSPRYNTARLANTSCDPNARSDVIRGHVWIIAERDIEAGEEITYDYHFDFDDDPAECLCGSPECIGYLVSGGQLKELRDWLRKEKRPIPPGLTKRLRRRG